MTQEHVKDNVDALLEEQIRYYRARAPEYDNWWARAAEHDFGAEFAASWAINTAELYAALDRFSPTGDVLELAAGTGIFTAALLRHADRITAVDASPEVLALNAARNGTERVEHVVADLFTWAPPRRWDHVVFGFWISHVPAARWSAFWALVDRALAPGGRVWFCDNADDRHVERHGPPRFRPATRRGPISVSAALAA